MKRNLMPLLGVAFVAAVVATGIFYGLLIPRLRGGSNDAPQSAVVAARSLDRGSVLRAEDIRVAELESRAVPANSLRSAEQAVGRTLLEPVSANQALTDKLLTGRGVAGGPSLAIPPGKRAVSVHPSDSSGVVSMLRSGSHVDIQVLDSRYSGGGVQLRRLLEDVEVLSIAGADAGPNTRPVVTLLVRPDDADRLSLADAAMQVRLILRNPADRATVGQNALTPRSLLDHQPVRTAAN